MGGTIARVGAGLATGGLSEIAKAGMNALSPKLPNTPGGPDAAALKATADAAANAVQSKEAEARRVRRAKTAQTMLTSAQGLGTAAPIGVASLQAPPARKTVLG